MELKAEIFAAAGQDLPARHDPGDQHLEPVGDRAVGRHRPAEQGHRDALLQPGAGHEAGRGRATVVTEPSVVEDIEALADRLGKVDVTIGDRAGFIANALLFGYLNHAVSMYEDRYASREDIDAAMRLGCGLPMGPLALMDLIGIDTAYEILDTMYKQSRNRLHAPSPIIKQMMTAGLLGRKSGRGFYTYAERDSAEVVDDAATPSAERCDRGCPLGARRSASSARAPWPPASSRSSPRAATTSASSPARRRRSRPCRRRWPSRWRSRSSAASSRRPLGTRSSAGSPARRPWTTSPTAT